MSKSKINDSGALWKTHTGECNQWYASTGDLGNGWAAQVSDYSQTSAPVQPTTYGIAAISRFQIKQKGTAKTLAEAKSQALDLALSLPDVGNDPLNPNWYEYAKTRR